MKFKIFAQPLIELSKGIFMSMNKNFCLYLLLSIYTSSCLQDDQNAKVHGDTSNACESNPLNCGTQDVSDENKGDTETNMEDMPIAGSLMIFGENPHPQRYRFIPPGTFTMGSLKSALGFSSGTQHNVTLTKGFWIKETEVTQEEWQAVMGNNPSFFSACGNNCPVENVNWWDAVQFCNMLSIQQGLSECYALTGCDSNACNSVSENLDCTGYRLPTEAEWEYAYRAGSTTDFYNGDSSINEQMNCNYDFVLNEIGWYCANSRVDYTGCVDQSRTKTGPFSCAGTHEVERKAANAWGLYDMAGNVNEWVWDWRTTDDPGDSVVDPKGPSSGSERIFRGGSWNFTERGCHAASRNASNPASSPASIGLRVVRPYQSIE